MFSLKFAKLFGRKSAKGVEECWIKCRRREIGWSVQVQQCLGIHVEGMRKQNVHEFRMVKTADHNEHLIIRLKWLKKL